MQAATTTRIPSVSPKSDNDFLIGRQVASPLFQTERPCEDRTTFQLSGRRLVEHCLVAQAQSIDLAVRMHFRHWVRRWYWPSPASVGRGFESLARNFEDSDWQGSEHQFWIALAVI